MSRVIIQGRCLWLCLTHATAVAIAMPETYDEMRALFPLNASPAPRDGQLEAERRSRLDRRNIPERRSTPQRTEDRRAHYGRRASDFFERILN